MPKNEWTIKDTSSGQKQDAKFDHFATFSEQTKQKSTNTKGGSIIIFNIAYHKIKSDEVYSIPLDTAKQTEKYRILISNNKEKR